MAEEKKEEPTLAKVVPVLKVDLDSDPKDSVAFALLEDWVKRVPEDEIEAYRLLYIRLWESVKVSVRGALAMGVGSLGLGSLPTA